MSSSNVFSHRRKHKPLKWSEKEDHESIYYKIKESLIAEITKLINAITELIDQKGVLMTLVNMISLSSHIFKGTLMQI